MNFIKDINNRIEYAYAYGNGLNRNNIIIVVDAYTRRIMLEDINNHKDRTHRSSDVFLWAPLER